MSNQRFQDNNDGTVTDKLSGLVWSKDADSFGKSDWGTSIKLVKKGGYRLPSKEELGTLLSGLADPHPFILPGGSKNFWTSTEIDKDSAWIINAGGRSTVGYKTKPTAFVWKVKDA